MHLHRLLYCVPIRHPVWLLMTLGIILTLANQVFASQNCRHKTPLPLDMRMVTPRPDIDATIARFVGVWLGMWQHDTGDETQCTTLVVEEVFANGYARVVYSEGTSAGWHTSIPSFRRATGKIDKGELRFRMPVSRAKLVYRFEGQTLRATYNDEAGAILHRVNNVRQAACGQYDSKQPPAPPAAGLRERVTAGELLGTVDTGKGGDRSER